MKDLRMSIIYDFEGDEGDFDDKWRYARPVLDGDNENHYGFGYCYEYDDFDPVFADGLAAWDFWKL
jgi:phage terminase large subunit-like protein